MSQVHHQAFLRDSYFTNPRTKHFEFQAGNGKPFEFRPGQFISVEIGSNGTRLRRPYSIASAPRADNGFDLCLNILPEGKASSRLFDLEPGEEIRLTGPFGFFTLREPPDPVTAFIATGTGIAPIRAMLQKLYGQLNSTVAAMSSSPQVAGEDTSATDAMLSFSSSADRRSPLQPKEIWLIYGVRTEADILYRDEFEKLELDHPEFHFIPTLSRPDPEWKGHRGYVQQHVARYLADKEGLHAYVCGLRKMVHEVSRELRALGYPSETVSVEKYD